MIRSLWLRLVLAQVAIAFVLALGLPFIVNRTIREIGDDLTQRLLSGEAAEYLAAQRAGTVQTANSPKAGAIALYMAQGHHLRRLSGPDITDLSALTPARLSREGFYHGPHSDFLTRPIGPGQTLVVAEDRQHPAVLHDDIVAYFLDRFIVIVPIALVCSTLASLWALARAIRPIKQAARDARALDPIRPGTARLREDIVPTEIEPLVHTANELLDRAVSGYERERVFAATVVHELRTALSTISLRTELLPGGEPRDKVVEAVAHANEVVTQMLGLHGREEELIRGKPRAVSAAAQDVIDDLGGLIRSSGHGPVSLRCVDSGPARLAPDALVRITVANIVENALRHTPAGAGITILCDDAAATVVVADSGPGIRMRSGSDGRKIYSRADGSPSRGSGLGIAIVTRLIETAGGSIAFGTSEAGGAAVTLCYPAAQERG
ncbi:HAMP domain-containing sensor histidine kinase [Novosphingobium sp.]|uniref:sensor histidine kinase n=1 Tax=Novosphingobium sp. TaxID=1874826 RepID=UPI002608A6FA|nr:HAMP domain-containing sensor histidine kinase [Novosphingobium sp.]